MARSLAAPLSLDIAGDPDSERALGKQRLSVAIGVLAGAAAVILVILLVVTARQCGAQGKNGYEAGKPEEDLFSPPALAQSQADKRNGTGERGRKPRRDGKRSTGTSVKAERSLYSGIVTVNGCAGGGRHDEEDEEEDSTSASERIAARYCAADGDASSPRLGTARRHHHQSSPDLARHYKSSSPLPAVHLLPHSPPVEGKKHQAVQELPPTNTFTGSNGAGTCSANADAMSLGSDQCSDYGCQAGNKYGKQVPHAVHCTVHYFNVYVYEELLSNMRYIHLVECWEIYIFCISHSITLHCKVHLYCFKKFIPKIFEWKEYTHR